MENPCPICQRALTKENQTNHIDYHCHPPKSDHHYASRVSSEGRLMMVKVRIASGKDKLFIKVNYDEGYSQVWTDPEDDDARIKINHALDLDVTDLVALRQKIRTYMVFS